MPRIDYGDGLVIDAPDGMSVLEASIMHGITHIHACGGCARCTTCRVNVLDGSENCPAMGNAEREALGLRGYKEPVRLACQLRPTGPIKVCCLLKEHPAGEALRPEGMAREREVAILFADVCGFTSFAECSLAFDVLHLLNRYFDRLGTIVEARHGHVITFLGDGVVCLFEDLDAEVAADSAVRCGVEILGATETFSKYSHEHAGFDMKVGVGIAWGKAVIGQLGYYNKSSLNVVGDVVNTAARVQEATRETGAPMLVTDRVKELALDHFSFGETFSVALRGKSEPQTLHEVLQ